MPFLITVLDGEPGGIMAPALPPLPITPKPATVQDAIAFLRRSSLPIEPRKQWPAGNDLPRYGLSGQIAVAQQARPGKALSIWGDAGWGKLVQEGKYVQGCFADELVEACKKMVTDWNPHPRPEWITCIPSLRHPELVPDFARRLATALNLPFLPVLKKTDARPA